MSSHLATKPGIVSGLYPEKQFSSVGLLDWMVDKSTHSLKCLNKFNKRSLQAFVNSVNQNSDVLNGLDNQALTERIKNLKHNLLIHGLEDTLVIESFALVREIADRELGMRHYDVQLMGGWVIIQGMTAEMETGEGKTLVATLPACTAAMAGIPVHIVTVNDYLVARDAQLMKPIFNRLGLSVGAITEEMDFNERQAAYACDITYCSNKQLTFDYLKDRMVFGQKGGRLQVQLERLYANQSGRALHLHLRGLCFAIVDEADSVLVDESRTPLILSRENESLSQLHLYQQALTVAEQLQQNSDFLIDSKNHQIELTETGVEHIQQLTATYTGIWFARRRSNELIIQALSAIYLFIKDVNYLVKDEKVLIIDEFTGRVMADRSWERGLHQLIETKEGCEISGQKETLLKISYQTFFRRYLHLAGITGTAKEVSGELFSVYRQAVIKIPTNKPCIRRQLPTRYFLTSALKWTAMVEQINHIHQQGRPVLIGTRSVETSEHLGRLLSEKGLPFRILNAKQDADEAEIIKQAGAWGCITVATNMAGRGTDIKPGAPVNEIGGLHVIASECHEARRIDRQLFGRCGRQGNAGSYEMFLSLEDEIVSKYGYPWLVYMAKKMHSLSQPGFRFIARLIFYWAQTTAERHHAAVRVSLLKMDENLQNILAFSGKSE